MDWQDQFINSGKTTVDLSLGYRIEVVIPYDNAQELDDSKEDPELADKIYTILEHIKNMIDEG